MASMLAICKLQLYKIQDVLRMASERLQLAKGSFGTVMDRLSVETMYF